MDTSTSPSLHGDTQEEIHTPLPQDTTHSTYMPTTNTSHPAEPQNLFQPHIPIDLTTPHSTPYTLHTPPPTPEAEAFHNFIQVDAQEKVAQARKFRALEDQLLEKTLLVERLINMTDRKSVV